MQKLVKILLPNYFQHLREIESHLKTVERKATTTVLTCASCKMGLFKRTWSECVEAVRSIAEHHPEIVKALDYILQEMSTTLQPKIYSTVVGLNNYFYSFEGLAMAVFWHKLLSCIDERSVIIQAKEISLEVEVNLIKSLKREIQKLRHLWADILQETRLVSQKMELPPVFFFFSEKKKKKKKKRNRLHSLATPDASKRLTAEDKFKTCIVYRVLDFFLQEL
ncbi:hypothetical protein PR048_011266 [Dryococelus australis]|uniref:Uncharacterized protein n=1 Tax=Dryococelus australis TaxID=614101 RepID=A0ABQ9HLL7_9NEOP|nr:hypothetical protein PR048_011266 [Dryococelus australis]